MSTIEKRERPLVLVADDDDDILGLVVFRLKQAGYDVATASDGAQALELAQTHVPDLVILDVMMPKLDGYEVTRRIRQLKEIKEVPIILLTARVQDADITRGLEAGADHYINKPFSPQELRERTRSILGRWSPPPAPPLTQVRS